VVAQRNHGLRVLLVGGGEVTQGMAHRLSLAGYRVEFTSSASFAIRTARTNPPDVVLFEFDGFGVEGGDVVGQLRGQPGWERPFVIGIAAAPSEAEGRAEQTGIDLLLVRPVDLGYLQRLLARFQRIVG
jgi:CheY-like chemotaxis protein